MTAPRMLRERRALPCPECGVMCSAYDWDEIGSCWKCGALLPRDDESERFSDAWDDILTYGSRT